MRQWQRTVEDLDSWTLEPLSLIDAGDRVVSRQRLHGIGEGPDLNVESTAIFTIRRAKVLVIEFHWDHAEALEALGLSE